MHNYPIEEWNKTFENSKPEEILQFFIHHFKNKIALASSLSAEDQILTHIIANINKDTKIFTLDTGRLFQECYSLISKTNGKYGINIHIYFPETLLLEEMVNANGVNLFYDSVESRKLCCNIRKIKPLQRALQGFEVWICGLRKEQSVTRKNIEIVEWDSDNKLLKINPLINWTENEVWNYVKKENIPYNELHDKGFASIGCMPCTRAIKKGEDIRAGRWWWENPETKECGLHAKKIKFKF